MSKFGKVPYFAPQFLVKNFSTFSVFAHWEAKNLKFWWWLMIVKYSKKKFGPNFDPLPDGIFEKFQRLWKALWKYFRAVAGQIFRIRPRKGSFWGSKLKNTFFDEKLAAGWSRGFPLEGKPMTFFEKFFLQKIANSKLYFYTVVSSKNFNRSGNANKNCALGAKFAPPVLLGLRGSKIEKRPIFNIFQKFQKYVNSYPILYQNAKFWGPVIKNVDFRVKKRFLRVFRKYLYLRLKFLQFFFSFSISSVIFWARPLIFF